MPSYEELAASVAELRESLAARDSLIAELQRLLEEARRAGKRQSAPFSKGEPSDNPARPGRKKGKGHGRHGHRMAPVEADRVLEVPAPVVCPGCGGATELERIAEQWQTELPESRPVTTLFKVHVRRCRSCARRVQGRHPEQTSDAIGAASAQVGPRAMAWGAWLHYGLGNASMRHPSLADDDGERTRPVRSVLDRTSGRRTVLMAGQLKQPMTSALNSQAQIDAQVGLSRHRRGVQAPGRRALTLVPARRGRVAGVRRGPRSRWRGGRGAVQITLDRCSPVMPRLTTALADRTDSAYLNAESVEPQDDKGDPVVVALGQRTAGR